MFLLYHFLAKSCARIKTTPFFVFLLLFMSLTYQYLVGGAKLTLTLENYPLKLKSTFGTSHSSTDFRLNGLCCIKINNEWIGWGECGLPPKKADVYFADFDDVKTYFVAFNQKVQRFVLLRNQAEFFLFTNKDPRIFKTAKSHKKIDKIASSCRRKDATYLN
jgi:hypothetical protein